MVDPNNAGPVVMVSTPAVRDLKPFQQAEKPAPRRQNFTNCGNKARQKGRRLTRVAFETSRLMEFCTIRELTNQVAHDVYEWPLVALKELVDNALDACEEADIAPVIRVTVAGDTITIADNGPGLLDSTISGILDYSVRVSSREVYAAPTRGAQGNALKTILAMAFVLDGERGETLIETRGIAHRVVFKVDRILLQPKIEHQRTASVTAGTRITVRLPAPEGCSHLVRNAKGSFQRMGEAYTWLNPHLSLLVTWNGAKLVNAAASKPDWNKWKPRDPTSAHWYDAPRFERYMAAHVARNQKLGRVGTVREFISEFNGLTSTAKQKSILTEIGASHVSLGDFFGTSDRVNHARIGALLGAMNRHSAVVSPRRLGVIGRDHLLARFEAAGGNLKTFKYQLIAKLDDHDVPRAIEIAFGVTDEGLKDDADNSRHREIRGLNWSPGIGEPFRSLGADGESLAAMLVELKVSYHDPVLTFINVAHPRLQYTDRGKSAVVID